MEMGHAYNSWRLAHESLSPHSRANAMLDDYQNCWPIGIALLRWNVNGDFPRLYDFLKNRPIPSPEQYFGDVSYWPEGIEPLMRVFPETIVELRNLAQEFNTLVQSATMSESDFVLICARVHRAFDLELPKGFKERAGQLGISLEQPCSR